MSKLNSKETLKLKKFSLIPILEGLDIYLNFSIITFLSYFFLPHIDNRASLIVMTCVVLLSFFSRLFVMTIIKVFQNLEKKIRSNIFFICSLFYIIPIFLLNEFLTISLIIFSLCRLLTGICLSCVHFSELTSKDFKNESNYFIKYSLLFIFGLILGNFIFLIVDDLLSIEQMNNWGWKIVYFCLFVMSLIIAFITKIKFKSIFFDFKSLNEIEESNTSLKLVPNILKNIFILLPLFVFLIFSSNYWLPRFANPENMQFLDFNLIFIFLIVLMNIFVFPLINLIGRKRSNNFLSTSVIFVSLILFLFEYTSSYSIEMLKFFVAIVSSFSLSIYFLNMPKIKEINPADLIKVHNSFFLIIFFIVPLLFYYFINYSISYNVIYLLTGLIFLISFLSGKYVK